MENKKMTPEISEALHISSNLIGMAQDFNDKARAMEKAHKVIDGLTETVTKQANEIESLKQQIEVLLKGKKSVTFLLDGSGSMTGVPLSASLAAVKEIVATRKNTNLIVYGDKHPLIVDVKDAAKMAAVEKGLGCGTDLAPTLDVILANPPTGKHHYVILSDGDLHDDQSSLQRMLEIKDKHPNIRFSAVLIGWRGDNPMQMTLNSAGIDYNFEAQGDSITNTVKNQIARAFPQIKKKATSAPKV